MSTILNTINAVYQDIKAMAGNILGGDGLEITLTDHTGAPIAFTGTLRMEVRKNAEAPAILVFAPGDGMTVVSNIITLIKEVNIAGGEYQYDISEVLASGSLKTYMYGKFIVIQNITNPRG